MVVGGWLYDTVTAARGLYETQAETALGRSSPAVVILDITLSDGDGAVWLHERRARGSTPPVVVVDSSARGAMTMQMVPRRRHPKRGRHFAGARKTR